MLQHAILFFTEFPALAKVKPNQIFQNARYIRPKHATSVWGPVWQFRVIARGQCSFFRRTAAAMASRWQQCV